MAVARLWQLSMAGHAVVVVFVALGIAAGVLSSGFIDSGNTRHGWSNKIKSPIHHRLDLHVLTLDSADSSPPASSLALLGQRSSRGAVIIDHHLHFHLSTAAVLQSTSYHRLRQHRHLRRPFYNKSATAEADEANLALLRDVAALGLGQRASIDESACDDCPFKAVPYVLWLGVSCCARGVAELQASAWPARRRSPLLLGPVRTVETAAQVNVGPITFTSSRGLAAILAGDSKVKRPYLWWLSAMDHQAVLLRGPCEAKINLQQHASRKNGNGYQLQALLVLYFW
ncbi:unnamed protein product [Urochloa humidicola]